jgi:hypothetical protein
MLDSTKGQTFTPLLNSNYKPYTGTVNQIRLSRGRPPDCVFSLQFPESCLAGAMPTSPKYLGRRPLTRIFTAAEGAAQLGIFSLPT